MPRRVWSQLCSRCWMGLVVLVGGLRWFVRCCDVARLGVQRAAVTMFGVHACCVITAVCVMSFNHQRPSTPLANSTIIIAYMWFAARPLQRVTGWWWWARPTGRRLSTPHCGDPGGWSVSWRWGPRGLRGGRRCCGHGEQ